MSDTQSENYEQNNQQGASIQDSDYVSRPGQSEIPVTRDTNDVESGVNPATEDSDETLAKDDSDAIDQSNVIEERTRGAKPADGTYAEPGDEEGLPGPDDGTSAVAS